MIPSPSVINTTSTDTLVVQFSSMSCSNPDKKYPVQFLFSSNALVRKWWYLVAFGLSKIIVPFSKHVNGKADSTLLTVQNTNMHVNNQNMAEIGRAHV